MNDAISKNKTTPESKAFWGLAQKASDEIEKWPAWKKGESENNTACQYCNTPLTLAHQQQAHNEQPCRGSLLAEIERLKAENEEWREELAKTLLSKMKLVEQSMQQQEKLIEAKQENKDLKRRLRAGTK